MEREYKCVDCGATFVRDTKFWCAAKRCPECKRLRINQLNAEWRHRQREKAFSQMESKKNKTFNT